MLQAVNHALERNGGTLLEFIGDEEGQKVCLGWQTVWKLKEFGTCAKHVQKYWSSVEAGSNMMQHSELEVRNFLKMTLR